MKRSDFIKAALGNEKADLVIKNAKIIDVLSHRLVKGDMAIKGNRIIGIGKYQGNLEIDGTGKFIAPGLIDCHIHIESTLLTPGEFAKIVVPFGVTRVFADPHEITNVCGEKGIKFMFEDSENVPLKINYMLPSCVPATPFEHNGSEIDAKKSKELLEKYPFFGLAEMMNYPGLLACDEDVLGKLKLFEYIDGHAPYLTGKRLNAYAGVGIRNDHECSVVEEAYEKIGAGMKIFVREGSGAHNLTELIRAINPFNLRHFCFCTDDKQAAEIKREGTIINCIRRAVENGLDAISAYTMATYNAAQSYGIYDEGALAPGYKADFIVLDNMLDLIPDAVYIGGKIVAEKGKPMFMSKKADTSEVSATVNIKPVRSEDFELEYGKEQPVIKITSGSLITDVMYNVPPKDVSICANIERYNATGNIGKCFVTGFKVNNGAIAQSIGHDSHNITAIGSDGENIAMAVNALGKNGGIAVVQNGKCVAFQELRIGGIMSDKSAEEVIEESEQIIKAVKQICKNGSEALMMILSFISLVVIPHVKLNDRGMFDVDKFKMFEG